MCEEEGAGSGDSASRKSPAADKVDFSGMDWFAGNGVSVISPLQLDKIAASRLISMMADKILMQASDVRLKKVRAVCVPARSKVCLLLYHLEVATRIPHSDWSLIPLFSHDLLERLPKNQAAHMR